MTARVLRNPAVTTWWPVVALPPILVADAVISSNPITVWRVLAAIVGCLPLVLRRRMRFVWFAPLLTVGIVLVVWALEPSSTVVLIPMVALFELAQRSDRSQSRRAAIGVVPCVFFGVLPFADSTGDFAENFVRNVTLCLLAIAAGEMIRTRDEAALRRVGDERLRIAREVHDVVAHAMVAINVQAGVAAHLVDRDPAHARESLREIKRTSGEALADLRAALGTLREPTSAAPVTPTGRLDAVDELTAGLRTAGVAVVVDVADLDGVPAAVHAAGYRIVQEALTNVLRHAAAGRVEVTVRRDDDAVRIDVADDGAGPSSATDGSGHGLRGMRERAQTLGGTVDSGPAPGGGWRVSARLPLTSAPVRAPA